MYEKHSLKNIQKPTVEKIRRKVEELEAEVLRLPFYSYERDYILSRLHSIQWDLWAIEALILIGNKEGATERLQKALKSAKEVEKFSVPGLADLFEGLLSLLKEVSK
jgi:translation elongation factor EF-1beta